MEKNIFIYPTQGDNKTKIKVEFQYETQNFISIMTKDGKMMKFNKKTKQRAGVYKYQFPNYKIIF